MPDAGPREAPASPYYPYDPPVPAALAASLARLVDAQREARRGPSFADADAERDPRVQAAARAVRHALGDYVGALRDAGAEPQHALVAAKRVLAAWRHPAHAQRLTDEAERAAVSQAIAAYYDR